MGLILLAVPTFQFLKQSARAAQYNWSDTTQNVQHIHMWAKKRWETELINFIRLQDSWRLTLSVAAWAELLDSVTNNKVAYFYQRVVLSETGAQHSLQDVV